MQSSFKDCVVGLSPDHNVMNLQTFCADFKTYFIAKPKNLHLIARFVDSEERNGKLSLLACSTLWALLFNAQHVKASLRPELLKLLTKTDGTLVLDHVLDRATKKISCIQTSSLATEIYKQTVGPVHEPTSCLT